MEQIIRNIQHANDHHQHRAPYSRYRATSALVEAVSIVLQPQIDITNGRIVGAEALARWYDAGQVQLDTTTVIQELEAHGSSYDLFLTIVKKTLAMQDRLYARGIWVPVAVNVSADVLEREETLLDLLEMLRSYQLPASAIKLEMTETGACGDPDLLAWSMNRLKEWGFYLSLDDLGTGISSLDMLVRLPFDEIKLDRSFIAHASSNAKAREIIENLAGMASRLNLDLVVEGVETAEQMNLILNANCRVAQGFHLYRPIVMPLYEAVLLATQQAKALA